jgi:hypothetical protein
MSLANIENQLLCFIQSNISITFLISNCRNLASRMDQAP